jgi:hypothetical protein
MSDIESGGLSRNERDILIKLLTKMEAIEPIVKELEKSMESNLKSLEDKMAASIKDLHTELDHKFVTKEELKQVKENVSWLQKVVYGACGIILVGVLTALVTVVVPKANTEAMSAVVSHSSH